MSSHVGTILYFYKFSFECLDTQLVYFIDTEEYILIECNDK